MSGANHYEYGSFRLDIERSLLFCGGNEVSFEPQMIAVLRVFFENPDQLLSKEFIAKKGWPETHVGPRNVPVQVAKVRRALGKYGSCIQPRPKRGYYFHSRVLREAKSFKRARPELSIAEVPGARARKGWTRGGGPRTVPMDGATGMTQIGDEWHTLRDSAEVHALVGSCKQGGTLYLVCINPEAFMPWREQIEAALCAGVKLRLAYVDVEHAASAGRAAEWYAASMCGYGVHIASASTGGNLIALSTSIEKARQRTGSDPDVQIYRSSFPHPFICAVYKTPVSSRAHVGWGLVSSYLLFAEPGRGHNFGVLFAEPGTVYDRYLSSVCRYFDFLQKNVVPDRESEKP